MTIDQRIEDVIIGAPKEIQDEIVFHISIIMNLLRQFPDGAKVVDEIEQEVKNSLMKEH